MIFSCHAQRASRAAGRAWANYTLKLPTLRLSPELSQTEETASEGLDLKQNKTITDPDIITLQVLQILVT